LEIVEKARANIVDNRWYPATGSRELSGIIACECGSSVCAKTMKPPRYPYYVCREYLTKGKRGCEYGRHWPAQRIEEQVRRFARDLVNKPEFQAEQVREYVEQQRLAARDPERTIKAWNEQLANVARKRVKNQVMYRADAINLDELQASNAELERQKTAAELALRDLRDQDAQLKYLDDLPEHVAEWIEECRYFINTPNPYPEDPPRHESRHQSTGAIYRFLYDELRFRVVIGNNGMLEIMGVGDMKRVVSCENDSSRSWAWTLTCVRPLA
jgi:hypothetical protein